MNKNNDPAFPRIARLNSVDGVTGKHIGYSTETVGGLTKLEWFAGKALQGLLGNSDYSFLFKEEEAAKLAATCYLYAEAMLKESEKHNGTK